MFTSSGMENKKLIFSTSFNHIQAEEGEKNCNNEPEIEKRVIEEFGRCLAQIIEFSGKNKKPSTSINSS